MRRADRLFQIVQILQARRLITAAGLAEELDVSVRTIYRDIDDLSRSGVPIRGEAGVGYALDRGYELPPLVFRDEEVAALVLGMRMLTTWADPELAAAARSALSKVEAVLPEPLRPRLSGTPLFALDFHRSDELVRELGRVRLAIDGRHKLSIDYVDAKGSATQRCLRPLGLFFWGNCWTVAAWCELRQGYRNFRLDRLRRLEVLEERFVDEEAVSLDAFFDAMRRQIPDSDCLPAGLPKARAGSDRG